MAEWISVKERLPEKDGEYLICTGRVIKIVNFYKDGIYIDDPCTNLDGMISKRFRDGFLIKWKPYPESLPYYETYTRIRADYWTPLPELPEEV